MIDSCFRDLFKLLADLLTEGNTLPTSTHDAKKFVCPMGMDYKNIHACLNDCVLYQNDEYSYIDKCPKCEVSHYKNKSSYSTKKGVSIKILWYLPIILRFRHLFSNKNSAKLLK